MNAVEMRAKSERLCLDLDNDLALLDEFISRIALPDESEYDLGYASLARAYSDDEPEYTHENLIWKNPNYAPRR